MFDEYPSLLIKILSQNIDPQLYENYCYNMGVEFLKVYKNDLNEEERLIKASQDKYHQLEELKSSLEAKLQTNSARANQDSVIYKEHAILLEEKLQSVVNEETLLEGGARIAQFQQQYKNLVSRYESQNLVVERKNLPITKEINLLRFNKIENAPSFEKSENVLLSKAETTLNLSQFEADIKNMISLTSEYLSVAKEHAVLEICEIYPPVITAESLAEGVNIKTGINEKDKGDDMEAHCTIKKLKLDLNHQFNEPIKKYTTIMMKEMQCINTQSNSPENTIGSSISDVSSGKRLINSLTHSSPEPEEKKKKVENVRPASNFDSLFY